MPLLDWQTANKSGLGVSIALIEARLLFVLSTAP
jgi:hypothetical protein